MREGGGGEEEGGVGLLSIKRHSACSEVVKAPLT